MKEITDFIKANISDIVTILSFASRLIFAVAIFIDCKARNIAAKTAYTISSFFFPFIAGIIYAIKRKSAPKAFKVCKTCGKRVGTYTNVCPSCGGLFLAEYENPKKKAQQIVSVILCIISIICLAVTNIVQMPELIEYEKNIISRLDNSDEYEGETDYDDDFEISSSELFYDKDGRAYSNETAVLYFSKGGDTYKLVYDEENEYFINTETGNRIETACAYVDSESNFYVIKEGMTHIDNDPYTYTISATQDTPAITVDVTFADEDGNIYYRATEASWNYSGNILISGNTLK